MITPAYVRLMAQYNSEMNRRLYAAAARLTDERRGEDGGAFWHSIHGTLTHLLWGDSMWMSRFDGWRRPAVPMQESHTMIADFHALRSAREAADARIEDWAGRVSETWLAEDLVWYSGVAKQERRQQRSGLVVHFFNHQTHHRGQAHALITRAGETTGDTDLMLVVPLP
ncbi:MAG: damage-inducible protein DinB [Rhodospirillales bacterium]|nr:damage-inducible protein DinB [Rhodospirillales bacterium]